MEEGPPVPTLGCWAQLHPVKGWPFARDLGRIWPRAFFVLSHSTGHGGDAVWYQPEPTAPVERATCAMGGNWGPPRSISLLTPGSI